MRTLPVFKNKEVIRIHIDLDNRNCIRKCRAKGHALLAKPGSDILCAAVTILLRTACRLLYSLDTVKKTGKIPEKGHLGFEISGYPETENLRISGITEFLMLGLNDLACEYQDRLEIKINKSAE